ncbi:MAG: leucine-rich repeat domain-containing protein [Parachlamydiales bacterium]|jgi:hypothetical protein
MIEDIRFVGTFARKDIVKTEEPLFKNRQEGNHAHYFANNANEGYRREIVLVGSDLPDRISVIDLRQVIVRLIRSQEDVDLKKLNEEDEIEDFISDIYVADYSKTDLMKTLLACFNELPNLRENKLSAEERSRLTETFHRVSEDSASTKLSLAANTLTNQLWLSTNYHSVFSDILKKRLENEGPCIHLSSQNVRDLPPALEDYKETYLLDLRTNYLVDLPEYLESFTELVSLELENNAFKHIPAVVFKLSKLDYLGMNENDLREIPDEISNLKELTVLFLEDNNITKVTESIGDLEKLININLSVNKLSTLPESINKLPLEELRLNHNNFTSVPECLFSLPSTCYIDFCDNPLTEESKESLMTRIQSPDYKGPKICYTYENMENIDFD